MLTARDATKDRVKGLDTGADDYLVKPFDLPELLARLRALIRRSAGNAHPEIELDEIRIDTRSKTVTKVAQPVTLTAREYSILEYLAQHRGELITRTELYEHLFDESDDTLSNLLDVHIFSIRKKLGHDLIVTRRGQGYSIEA
jgi:two-component system OmpR family response regulator